MHRLPSVAFTIGGAALLVCGRRAYHSFGSGISRLFTGAPTDRSLWLLIGGGLMLIAGLNGLFRRT
jgi:hypothetical protein